MTIVLPATTDCASNGAVCTEDGRKLSSALEITVPGREEQQESNSPATGAADQSAEGPRWARP